LGDIVNTLAASGPSIDDINSAANDAAVGVGTPTYTIDENHNRSSVRDHLVRVQQASQGKLQFAFDTLATKVLLCRTSSGESPVAYGVEISPGAALAVAGNFNGKQNLETKTVTVRHEVIISAGVFQSPQLVRISSSQDSWHLLNTSSQLMVFRFTGL
jgi:choline dehydrogenase